MAQNRDTESEPLLGRPGDATQHGQSIAMNLWIGTAVLAQAGIWILAAIVWAAILEDDLALFSIHPLTNAAGLFLLTQAILILQPTGTAAQKKQGTQFHFALHCVGVIVLFVGLIAIEYNKGWDAAAHFKAVHNYLGVAFYVLVVLQALVGATSYFTPGLYGGVENAKALYKYHRVGGYVTLLLGLATVCSVYWTSWNKNVGGLRLWTLIVSSVLVVVGVFPRIKLAKLGLKQ